jgi:hypothetical protein
MNQKGNYWVGFALIGLGIMFFFGAQLWTAQHSPIEKCVIEIEGNIDFNEQVITQVIAESKIDRIKIEMPCENLRR